VLADGEAVDARSGRSLRLFPEVAAIFAAFHECGVPVAIASASPAASTATRLLRGFGLDYAASHIAPGRKDTHLKKIAGELRISLAKAVFFDDLPHNIKTAESLGCLGCVQVGSSSRGVCREDVRLALKRMRERGRGAALMRAWMQPKPAPPAASGPAPSAAACEADEVGGLTEQGSESSAS